MKRVKYSTKLGKSLFEKGCKNEGTYLHQIYEKYSYAKEQAFEKCFEEYLNEGERGTFSIISHNSWGFSCSWLTLAGDWRIETPYSSYIVLLSE